MKGRGGGYIRFKERNGSFPLRSYYPFMQSEKGGRKDEEMKAKGR